MLDAEAAISRRSEDVELLRTDTVAGLAKEVSKHKAKLEDAIREAWVTASRTDMESEDESHINIVKSRIAVAVKLLGLGTIEDLTKNAAGKLQPPQLDCAQGEQPTPAQKKKLKADFAQWLADIKQDVKWATLTGADVVNATKELGEHLSKVRSVEGKLENVLVLGTDDEGNTATCQTVLKMLGSTAGLLEETFHHMKSCSGLMRGMKDTA